MADARTRKAGATLAPLKIKQDGDRANILN